MDELYLIPYAVIDVFILPVLIFGLLRKQMKMPQLPVREALKVYGWSLCAENLVLRFLTHVLESFLHRDVIPGLLIYAICVCFCSLVVGFLAALVEKNITVDDCDEEKE